MHRILIHSAAPLVNLPVNSGRPPLSSLLSPFIEMETTYPAAQEILLLDLPRFPLATRLRQKQAPARERDRKKKDELFLLAFLRSHHGDSCQAPEFEAVSQKNIQKQLSQPGMLWSQSRVSRTLKSLMSKSKRRKNLDGVKKYEALCFSREIIDALSELENVVD